MSPPSFPPAEDSARLQARLAAMLDVALDCIVTVDHAGRFIDFNPAAERTFGYARDEAVGRDMTDLIVPPHLRAGHRAGMGRILAGGAPRLLGQRIEITAMRRDGTEFPVELAITRLAIDGPPIFTAHLRDITERRRTESELRSLQAQLEQRIADRTAELAAAKSERDVSSARQRESQTYFEKSFHASPALMSLVDAADGRILEANPAFLRGAGLTREDVVGRTTLELGLWLNPAQRDEFFRLIRTAGAVRDFEADFRSRTGLVRTLILNADIVEVGGRPCLLNVGIDVSERRRRDRVQAATYQISQAALAGGDLVTLFREVHRIIASLIPARNLYVAVLSDDGSLLSFPYFVDEHSTPPPPRKPGSGLTEYVLDTREPLLTTADRSTQLARDDARYAPIDRPAAQWLGAPLVVGGRAIGVIAVQDYHNAHAYGEEEKRLLMFVADQTAAAVHRRESAEALERAERQYRGIFENALEGLYQTTPDGRFLRANPALARMCGYATPAELLRDINDVGRQLYVVAGRRDEFMQLIAGRDEVTDFESEIQRRDGTRLWVSESVRAVRNAAGELSHFEGVAVDITQQREAARALQLAKDAADAASRAKSYFLASVSHELRTPLNGILGYTQILRRDPALGDKQRDGVRVIHESADHLLALINDVLDLSKIEAGRIDLHPTDFDLVEFTAGVERVFAPRARDKSILLESALGPNLPRWVHGDEQRLRQIIYNLAANAVKFTDQGGVVLSVARVNTAPGSVTAGEAPAPADHAGGVDLIRFSVRDTGPGIAAGDLGKLFEPFSQVGTPTGTGTGLGLAISRSLVQRLGGELHVESELGRGSCFWFEVALPAATIPGFAPAPAFPARRVIGYEGRRRRVLVVDDNSVNRAVLVDLLAPLGFELTEAADGETAVSEALRTRPDLVLMDLRLPGRIDGLEATRRIRADEAADAARDRRCGLVAVSASAYDLDRNECFRAGCDAFLAKPFREEELWLTLERVSGLAWRHADTEETRTPFPQALHAPPPAEAAAIHELAAKGDVLGLRARVQALVLLDPRCEPFAQCVLDLAGRFKMKAVRQFVAPYLPSIDATNRP